MKRLKADLVIKKDDITEIKSCIIMSIGYSDNGFTNNPCAIVLVDGELKEYNICYLKNVEFLEEENKNDTKC